MKPGVWEDTPFGPNNIVFKVSKKMFALLPIDTGVCEIILKATPDNVAMYLENYEQIGHAPYFSKVHWFNIVIDSSFSINFINGIIDESYNLVYNKLTKLERAEIDLRE